MNGLEVCRRVRVERAVDPPHVILLTARQAKQDRIAGLAGGASPRQKPHGPPGGDGTARAATIGMTRRRQGGVNQNRP
jgi:CheY-like chemotaxis protein